MYHSPHWDRLLDHISQSGLFLLVMVVSVMSVVRVSCGLPTSTPPRGLEGIATIARATYKSTSGMATFRGFVATLYRPNPPAHTRTLYRYDAQSGPRISQKGTSYVPIH